MKRLSYNYCLNTIKTTTSGWLHLNASGGGYQLQEYCEQYSATANTLKSGTLREVWDKYQGMRKDKFDFIPEHLFEFQKPAGATGFTLSGFVSGLQATVTTLKEVGKTGAVADQALRDCIQAHLTYYRILHMTLETEHGTVFFDPERVDSHLKPVVPYAYTFARSVKPLTAEDMALHDNLPASIAEHVFSRAQKEVVTALYYRYVEPICKGIAGAYTTQADPYLTTGKRPNITQAMLQTLRWVISFTEKGPLTREQAADLFYSQLDAVAPMQQFVRAFYAPVN